MIVSGLYSTARYGRCCLALVYCLRGSVSMLAHTGPYCLRRTRVSTRVNPDSVTDELSYFVI